MVAAIMSEVSKICVLAPPLTQLSVVEKTHLRMYIR